MGMTPPPYVPHDHTTRVPGCHRCELGADEAASQRPHITDLLDLTPAVDAALIGMTAHELKAQGDPDPTAKAAALWEDTDPTDRQEARAIILAAVYPAARAIAEQAYARAWADAREEARLSGNHHDPAGDLAFNPFTEGAVDV